MDGWRASIPQEIGSDPEAMGSLAKVEDLPGLIKSYVSSQKMIGGSVRVPKDEDSPEEWDKFYGKMGRPEKVEGYKITRPQLQEGLTYDEALEKGFLENAHKIGLSQRQAQNLVDWFNGYQGQLFGTMKGKVEEGKKTLETEWGQNFEKNLDRAHKVLSDFGDDDVVNAITQSGLNYHPAFIKMMVKIGEVLSEDGLVRGQKGGLSDASEAQRKIDEIRSDLQHPYNNPNHPFYRKAQDEMVELNKRAVAK